MITLSDLENKHIYMPSRSEYGHKGDFGHIHMIGGSVGMSGAICLSSHAALRCGSGLVTVLLPKTINNIFEIKNTECMSVPLDDFDGIISSSSYENLFKRVQNSDCVAFGMGIGRNPDITYILAKLLKDYKARYMGIGEVDPDMDLFYEDKQTKEEK